MKINKEPRERGDYYEPEGFDWIFFLVCAAVILGIVIVYVEVTGTADALINSFE
jgi:hypothetical protein